MNTRISSMERNEKPFPEREGNLAEITICAYGRLRPFSCALRWAFHNARAYELPEGRRCGRTAA